MATKDCTTNSSESKLIAIEGSSSLSISTIISTESSSSTSLADSIFSSTSLLEERKETTRYRKMAEINKAVIIKINALVFSSPGNGSSKLSRNDFSSASSISSSSETIVLKDKVPLLDDTKIIESPFVVA